MVSRPFGRRVFAAVLRLAAALGLATAASAQPALREAEPVPDVVVWGHSGPALWRVAKGGSELVILGSVTPTPRGGTWNTRLVAEALHGARVLMLSPGSTPGLAWADDFRESQRYRLRQSFGRTLAGEIAPDAMARLDRMATAIGQPLSHYSSYRPGPAGMILLEDSWRARGLTGSKVDDAVVGLAKAAHVRVIKVDEGGALPLIDAMPSMSKAQHAACISDAMDQFDQEGGAVAAEFDAWANGDLAPLRSAYRPLGLCLDSIPGGSKRLTAARATWIKALAAALQVPGRAVAVMDVADLLEPSELLAALRAQGATVTPPRNALTPEAASRLMALNRPAARAPAPAERADTLPADLETPTLEPLQRLPASGEVRKGPGRAVHLAQGDTVCVQESSIGTFFLHSVCHTQAEWAHLEQRRNLNQVRDLKTGKALANGGE